MHPIDRAAAIMIRRGPRRLRIFPGGWGDTRQVALLYDGDAFTEPPPPLAITWGPTKHLNDRTTTDGHFEAFSDLPPEASIATIRLIEPVGGADRLCLLMAAWNDHGYDTRQHLADELLQRDIASLILEIPYDFLPIFHR